MKSAFSRRDFLKLSALSVASLAFRPKRFFQDGLDTGDIARVAIRSVSVYSEPTDKSQILYQRFRDDLVNIYYELVSEDGPGYNPIWYRVWNGYIHSAHLVRVKNKLNPVEYNIPETAMLTEVTVPYSQSYRNTSFDGWTPLYRLYYGSTHWVREVVEGPDGEPWYKIEDEADVNYIYYAPAAHFRPIPDSEIAPISPDVPPDQKRIEISIPNQTLTAYERDEMVLFTKISSGVPQAITPPGLISTDTPKGNDFHVYSKMPSKHMGDGFLTADLNAYELPGVPWVTFFVTLGGVAIHGTYWHTNFGTPMSHGCVNMRTEEAKWIFRWANPVVNPGIWEKTGYGTRIIVA
jgi:lipoprotein-anchoring transpeptidase ErfK/SrfK